MKKSILCVMLLLGMILFFCLGEADAYTHTPLHQAVQDACWKGQPCFLDTFEIEEEDLDRVFWELYRGGKLPWYMERTYQFTYDVETEKLRLFMPAHLDQETYDRRAYEQSVAEIIDAAISEGMSDWEKALAIHDYLVANCTYDEPLTYFRGYDLLVRGTAVCSGYAEAYMDIMNRLGVQTIIVESEAMEHGWNLVKLEDSWYHVDLTWDDPTPDITGTVVHDYFLKTDAEFLAEGQEGHHSWQAEYTCTDTRFADAFWLDVDSWICSDGGRVFLRRQEDGDTQIWVREIASGEETRLYREEAEYIDIGYGEYSYCQNLRGLTLWNDRLFFNNQRAVYSIATDGTDLKEEYVHDYRKEKTFICGSRMENGVLHLTLADHDFTWEDSRVPLSYVPLHTHSYQTEILAATCEAGGYTTYICQCGVSFHADPTEPLGHTYDAGVGEKTPEGTVLRYTCSACGHSYTVEQGLGIELPETDVLLLAAVPMAVLVAFLVIRRRASGRKRR